MGAGGRKLIPPASPAPPANAAAGASTLGDGTPDPEFLKVFKEVQVEQIFDRAEAKKGYGYCQRWRVGDGLSEVVNSLKALRDGSPAWAGGTDSPAPLAHLPADEAADVRAALAFLEPAQQRLLMRMYNPDVFDGSVPKHRARDIDAAYFFAQVPEQEVQQIEAGFNALKAAARKHAANEFAPDIGMIDPGTRARQGIILKSLRDVTGETLRIAKRCSLTRRPHDWHKFLEGS